jgi:hypothetical protein
VSISPRRLRLQILCKSGAPIEPILHTWSTLPIVVRYKGSRKPKSLPSNIVAAFRHPDRICDIDIGVTSSVLDSVVGAMRQPLPLRERVRMDSNESTGHSVIPSPGIFMCGSTPRTSTWPGSSFLCQSSKASVFEQTPRRDSALQHH